MADQGSLNGLLQWSIENSASKQNDANTNNSSAASQPKSTDASRGLNAEALRQLLGGPSDADRMREAMTAIIAPVDQVDLTNKLVAWDNLEQLIEQIDNANNLESLGMWSPLTAQLDSEHAEMRACAAACVSTAVQNNIKCQERLCALEGVLEKLVRLATGDHDRAVRKKAVSALSSEVRNYQPGLDEVMKHLSAEFGGGGTRVDAANMDAVDELIGKLRANAIR